MSGFSYAHGDTSKGEKPSLTSPFNEAKISEKVRFLKNGVIPREIPTADEETLSFLQTVIGAKNPENILEIGTAVGISAAVMLETCPAAHLLTIERDESFYNEAKANLLSLNLSERAECVLGDAGEVIEKLTGEYDFIFLDCAKAQYIKYLPRLKKLLKKGGVLFADDVLLFGWLTGECPVPKKRKMLFEHISEYVQAVKNDSELYTTIINIGDGVALSVKRI